MRRIVTAVLAVIFLTNGAVPCFTAEPVSSKDTLTMSIDREPVSLDPIDVFVNVKGMIDGFIYDTLLDFDNKMHIVPGLAESWKQIDNLTWQFNLRKGVKFHDGSELKASDVLFSLKRASRSSVTKKRVQFFDLEHSSCPDDHTFILKLSEPYAFVEAQLCNSSLSIVSEKAVASGGEQYGRNPVGTGPYKFASWTAGDRIIVERNDDYWGRPSILKTLVVRIITESSSRTIELESGGVDLTLSLSQNDARRIEENPEMLFYAFPSNSLRYIGFNCDKEIFKDIRVRQALNHATDTAALRPILYGEKTSGPALSCVPEGMAGANTNATRYDYNPEKAKALLKDAGYENNLTVEFMYLANSTNNMLAELLQQMWGEVGVTLKLKPTESGALSTALNKGEQEMCSAGTTFALGEAGEGLNNMFNSATRGSSGNRTNLSDPAIDELLNKIVVTSNAEERDRMVYDVQELIAQQAPMIYLASQYNIIGAAKKLKGFEPISNGMYDFTACYFE